MTLSRPWKRKFLHRRIALLLEDVPDSRTGTLTIEEQGEWYLGFYHERNFLQTPYAAAPDASSAAAPAASPVCEPDENSASAPMAVPSGNPVGAPRVENRLNWSDVDWSLSDPTIARSLGCSRQAVRNQRKKRQPQ